jgi:hypothetical protein
MTSVLVVRRGLTRIAAAGGFALTLLGGCDNPAKPIPGAGDPENISRVTVKLTPAGGGTTQTSFRVDPDGSTLPQPVGAAQGTLALTKGVTYNGTIELKNDLDPNNVVDITAEVEKEKDFHQFVYTFEVTGSTTACNGISAGNLSLDSNGQPTGLTYTVTVTAGATSTTTCNMHVVLKHYEGPKSSSSTVIETDLDMTFPVTIS